MNFYQFLKGIQDGVGCGCTVSVRLNTFMDFVDGLQIQIDWENDFHYRFIVLETHLKNTGFLEHFQKYVIHHASKSHRIAEVGED